MEEYWRYLADKAAAGVDVRIMYDGACELPSAPRLSQAAHALGSNVKWFCPALFRLSPLTTIKPGSQKNLVIDGIITAFNGGVNLADNINEITRFGHWKDTAGHVEGEAVRSFTLMFLQMWGIDREGD